MKNSLLFQQPAVAKESDRLVRLLKEKISEEKKKLLKKRIDILYFAFSGNIWRYQEEEIESFPSDSANGVDADENDDEL